MVASIISSMPVTAAIDELLARNRRWAAAERAREPACFQSLSRQQHPRWLWIGCADSRVHPDEILDLPAGEVLVHRNVANQVVCEDHNCQAVVQLAVEVFAVPRILVCGHYGCSGVAQAGAAGASGPIEQWLEHVRCAQRRWQAALRDLDERPRLDLLSALNVLVQIERLSRSPVVTAAWARGAELQIHGLVYGLHDGLLHSLSAPIGSADDLAATIDDAARALVAHGPPGAPI